jgi:RNA polymerase sigma-54 factor
MALRPRLEIRQAQSLTLTPQLMQSIRLLQFGHLELQAFVDAELERNPLLERDDSSDEPIGPAEEAAASTSPETDVVDNSRDTGTAETIADTYDNDMSNVFQEQRGQDGAGATQGLNMLGAGEASDLEDYVSSTPSLADHLAPQIALLVHTPADRMIAHALVDHLNETGYLGIGCDVLAEQLGCDIEDVDAVLERIQGCDPAGVFARDVRECLALQLKERNRLDPMMQTLLDRLDLVANRDIAGLCKAIGTDREDVLDMLAELRTLDPRPGRAFDAAPVEAVVPDVFVKPSPEGGWAVELNTDILPKVLVNRTYYAEVSRQTRNGTDKSFLTDCLQTANWLTKSLDQRAQTILKVAAEIVKQQDRFLLDGVQYLRPMTLKMVAEAIEMHESTVSRVTSNKYLATPRGLFEMKYFFTTALSSASGDADHSSEAVRHRIRQLIEAESADSILSDDTIADILKKEQGINVARRTVAKYREGMGLPSSVIRRREKRAAQMA